MTVWQQASAGGQKQNNEEGNCKKNGSVMNSVRGVLVCSSYMQKVTVCASYLISL